MATALVPLCLVAKLKDGRLIPVDVNQFRNSYLGVKALRLNFDKETDASNRIEKQRLDNEIKEAEENPYHSDKLNIDIHIVAFITMVLPT